MPLVVVSGGATSGVSFDQNGYLDSLTVTERSLVNCPRERDCPGWPYCQVVSGGWVPGTWGMAEWVDPWCTTVVWVRALSHHWIPTVTTTGTILTTTGTILTTTGSISGSISGHFWVNSGPFLVNSGHFWSILVHFSTNFSWFSTNFREFSGIYPSWHISARRVDPADMSCPNPYPNLEGKSDFVKKWSFLHPVFAKV